MFERLTGLLVASTRGCTRTLTGTSRDDTGHGMSETWTVLFGAEVCRESRFANHGRQCVKRWSVTNWTLELTTSSRWRSSCKQCAWFRLRPSKLKREGAIVPQCQRRHQHKMCRAFRPVALPSSGVEGVFRGERHLNDADTANDLPSLLV